MIVIGYKDVFLYLCLVFKEYRV